mmetsp:Transcript_104424/g.184925  ORF Transcript_104424/g.184925 Transcript_104424/m.184925 type:complete len:263 (+) Transcript_104424:1973-2761(+)
MNVIQTDTCCTHGSHLLFLLPELLFEVSKYSLALRNFCFIFCNKVINGLWLRSVRGAILRLKVFQHINIGLQFGLCAGDLFVDCIQLRLQLLQLIGLLSIHVRHACRGWSRGNSGCWGWRVTNIFSSWTGSPGHLASCSRTLACEIICYILLGILKFLFHISDVFCQLACSIIALLPFLGCTRLERTLGYIGFLPAIIIEYINGTVLIQPINHTWIKSTITFPICQDGLLLSHLRTAGAILSQVCCLFLAAVHYHCLRFLVN